MINEIVTQFQSNPRYWDDALVLSFMRYLKFSQNLIVSQQAIQYKGSDFLIHDENHLFQAYRAQNKEEKLQLQVIRHEIHTRVNSFKANDHNSKNGNGNGTSSPNKATGNQQPPSIGSDKIDGSDNIEFVDSAVFRYNKLPYDPFDLDFGHNFEEAKSTFQIILKSSQLHQKYHDFSLKRSLEGKVQTQLVLEVKKLTLNQQPLSKVDKYAIKENQTITLGSINADLLLQESTVSKRHAVIENIGGLCSVQDLGSSCGTFVRIHNQQITLAEGSIFECGYQEFQVVKINPRGDSASIRLYVYQGMDGFTGKTYDLEIENKLIIGNDSKSMFGSEFHQDKQLSQFHSKLSMKDNVLSIMDLGSKKGTWLRLSPQKQKSGKYMISNDTEIKINPFLINMKINQIEATDMQSVSGQKVNSGCMSCKQQATMKQIPCGHVIFCKNCYSQIVPASCHNQDCKMKIQSAEMIKNS